jgi:uncharacterized protein YdeI (YjbR/CyaY-like superfamily)
MKNTNTALPAVLTPAELREALADDPWSRDYFERLPPSHRRKYVDWVAAAKKEQTRARRAARVLEMLRARMSKR